MIANDAYGLSDLLLGRIDAFRANVNGLMEGFARRNAKGKEEPQSTGTTLQQRLDRAEQNMLLLDNCGPRFEASTHALQDVGLPQRNLLVEFQWRRDVRENGLKATNSFREQLNLRFPDLDRLNQDVCPPGPPKYFMPRCSKRQRLDKPNTSFDEILDSIAEEYSNLTLSRVCHTETKGKRVTSVVKCVVSNEFVVYLSFSPNVSNSISTAPPDTPSSLMSAETLSVQSVVKRSDRRAKRVLKKKSEDMASKARQAAEEANKIEMDELITRTTSAYESAKDHEIARIIGTIVSDSFHSLAVYSTAEDAPDLASGTSKFPIFVQMTQYSTEAMQHYRKHFRDTSLHQFFAYLSTFSNLFQTPCAGCKKILSRRDLLPPTFRTVTLNQPRPYHTECLPSK